MYCNVLLCINYSNSIKYNILHYPTQNAPCSAYTMYYRALPCITVYYNVLSCVML